MAGIRAKKKQKPKKLNLRSKEALQLWSAIQMKFYRYIAALAKKPLRPPAFIQ
jgi:hypothetical protein